MSDLGNKTVMAANLKRMLASNDINQKKLCQDLDIAETTFSGWINGKVYPRIDKIELMANYFGVAKSDLIERPITAKTSSAVRIPVLGAVPAGIPLEAIEDVIDYEEIPERQAQTGSFFGLRISGHSMEPLISDGDVVIVLQVPDVESGSIAIVMVNGYEATCKKVLKQEGGIVLQPLNPTYDPAFYSDTDIVNKPVRIIGKVVELRRKF